MKLFNTFYVLILALTLKAQANETNHETTTMPSSTCTAESDKNCTQATAMHDDKSTEHGAATHHGPKKAAKDWTDKRIEQVASILPEKTKAEGLNTKPEKVSLISPKFLSKVPASSVKLEWTEAKGAQNYHVQISKDAGFNNRSMFVTEDKWVKGTSFEVKDLEPGVKYFWRIAAVNSNQETQFTKSLFVSSAFETESK